MAVPVVEKESVTIRFAGDSGDGMQLAGDQLTDTSALMGNDVATFPDFPAEIRAPQGTLPGVSSFQIQFSKTEIFTAGDAPEVLVTMNPAALKVNLKDLIPSGLIIVNSDSFNEENLEKAGWAANPLLNNTLEKYSVLKLPITTLTRNALKETTLKLSEVDRSKNFFALGFVFWLYDRNPEFTVKWIEDKFSKKPELLKANILALKAGYNYAEITEVQIPSRFTIKKAEIAPGTYRKITGNEAASLGIVAAAHLSGKQVLFGAYPITPASTILHDLGHYKNHHVKCFQAEDEIAACGAALGASYAGHLGITATSGPGVCLKSEMINLAVMVELPLVIINAQRGGPSTGMPTKTEQTDLLQAMFGRNGDSPVAIVAPATPAHCFEMILEAIRIATKYMCPVFYLTDGYLAAGSEPWKLPEISELQEIKITSYNGNAENFLPYLRNETTLARPWVSPGTKDLEHRIGGIEKADRTGNVSYDPDNHQKMTNLRREKISRIANDIPLATVSGPETGKLLVLSWGSSYGAVHGAMQQLEREGKKVSACHLHYLNPFPKNLGDILKKFKQVLIPELNMGQLLFLIRAEFPSVNAEGFNKLTGQPFKIQEIKKKAESLL